MRCERYSGGGWSSLPGGKRRGRGKRGCRGGTFSRVTAGAPAAGGWWVGSRGEEAGAGVVVYPGVRERGGWVQGGMNWNDTAGERGRWLLGMVRGGGRRPGSGGLQWGV